MADLNAEKAAESHYCARCDFYTDHVSTAHDGLRARDLLLSRPVHRRHNPIGFYGNCPGCGTTSNPPGSLT